MDWLPDGWQMIALMFGIGALSGAGIVLKHPDSFRFRYLIGWMFHGGVTALIGGLLLISLFPEHRDDAAMVAGLAAIVAGIGTERMITVVMALLKKKLDPDNTMRLSELIKDDDTTQRIRERFGITGEFNQDEIAQAIAAHRAKKAAEKARKASGDSTSS